MIKPCIRPINIFYRSNGTNGVPELGQQIYMYRLSANVIDWLSGGILAGHANFTSLFCSILNLGHTCILVRTA